MDSIPRKQCTICGEWKDVSEYYVKIKETGRLMSWCKTCHKIRTTKYASENKAQYAAYMRERRAKDPETARQKRKVWRDANIERERAAGRIREKRRAPRSDVYHERRSIRARERRAEQHADILAKEAQRRDERRSELRAYHRSWSHANPERLQNSRRRSNEANAGKRHAYNRAYQKANAGRYNAHWHARRARKLSNGGSHTETEWEQLKRDCGDRCLMCGRSDVKLTKDHIVPINLGGTDDITNIQPLCQPCNSRKSDTILNLRE